MALGLGLGLGLGFMLSSILSSSGGVVSPRESASCSSAATSSALGDGDAGIALSGSGPR